MPELPEVETMVRGLRPAMVGGTLTRVDVRDAFLLENTTAAALADRALGATVESVLRRGKWVVMRLRRPDGFIVIQPRMTGGFWLVEPERPEHVRVVLGLRGTANRTGTTVWFCDARRLGKVAWYGDAESAEAAFRKSQGPDALEIEAAELSTRLKATTRPIKPALMDQKVVAGIGNIYADEILFEAGIHPERRACDLKPAQLAAIHRAVGSVLTRAIAAEGSSFDAGYRTVLGLEGGFLAESSVHRRKGQSCHRCGVTIIKTRIIGLIGRPTYYCPGCQRPPRLRGASGSA